MVIGAGENVTFNMAGFTNHNFTGITSRINKDERVGYGGGEPSLGAKQRAIIVTTINTQPPTLNTASMHAIPILPEASAEIFTSHWREGTYVKHAAGFVNSTFELTVKSGKSLTPGTTYR